MCLADRRDWGIVVPANAWTKTNPYTAKIELGAGDYGLPFDVESAWIAGIDNAEPCFVEIRNGTASAALIAGTLPCPVGELHAPMRGFGRHLHLTASGADLTAAPDLAVIFRTETGC